MGKRKIVKVITQQRAYVAREVKEEREENQEGTPELETPPEPQGPTNSEIAAKLGISKRQVAKMRRENTLQEALEKIEETS
jgi:DNA-directed RNA polymerase specialized sigma subunit